MFEFIILLLTLCTVLIQPYESPLKARKVPLTPKRTPTRELNREEPKEECRWEESENILRRIEGDTAPEDVSKDTRHLLVEIEELKQKLWEKDCLLETLSQRSNQPLESHGSQTDDSQKPTEKETTDTTSWQSKGTEGNDPQGGSFEFDRQLGNNASHGNGINVVKEKSADMKLLQAQIDELRQELAEKDRYVQSAQLELREQQVHDSSSSYFFVLVLCLVQHIETRLIVLSELSDIRFQ